MVQNMKERIGNQRHGETSSRFKTREAIYDKLERKISILKDVWITFQTLSVPSPSDPLDSVHQERQIFQDFSARLDEQLPEAVEAWNRMRELNHKEKLTAEEKQERLCLSTSTDFSFFTTLCLGMEEVVKKRETIRDVFRQLGENAYLSPENYDDFFPQREGWQTFRGRIKGIVPQRFSICPAVHEKTMSAAGYSKAVVAMHLEKTIWNAIRSDQFVDDSIDFGEPASVITNYFQEAYPEILLHEDFHSFIECFLVSSVLPTDILENLKRGIVRLKSSRRRGKEALVKKHARYCEEQIVDFVDEDLCREEYLAELGSSPLRNGPRSSAEIMTTGKFILLQRLVGEDEIIDRHISSALEFLDTRRMSENVSRLYRKVRKQAPEKTMDLDVSFALFPPSQIRHIEKLVRKWTM